MDSQLLYPVYSLLLNVPRSGSRDSKRIMIRTGLRVFDFKSLDAAYMVLGLKMFGRVRPDRVFFGFEYFRLFRDGKLVQSSEFTSWRAPFTLVHAFTNQGDSHPVFPGWFKNPTMEHLMWEGVDSTELEL